MCDCLVIQTSRGGLRFTFFLCPSPSQIDGVVTTLSAQPVLRMCSYICLLATGKSSSGVLSAVRVPRQDLSLVPVHQVVVQLEFDLDQLEFDLDHLAKGKLVPKLYVKKLGY